MPLHDQPQGEAAGDLFAGQYTLHSLPGPQSKCTCHACVLAEESETSSLHPSCIWNCQGARARSEGSLTASFRRGSTASHRVRPLVISDTSATR